MTELAESTPVPAILAEPRPRVASSLSDDAQLIEACRRGDARAMEMLYHQFKRRVFGKVIRRYWHHAWYFVPQAIVRGGIDTVHAAIEVTAPEAA